jgi:peptide/nickel transport system ATP-binding protein
MREFRRHVQLVLQDPYGALNPRQNVHDAVAEGLRLHGQRAGLTRRVSEALDQVGMRPPEHFFERYPHQLSGGQQQRVVIAGALTLGPDVLVADEPVSSLDASVRGEILKLFLQLRDDLGLAALVVSHDLGLAWNIADRVAVMYLGRIVEVGTVEDVLLRPQHPYTRALLDAVPSTTQKQGATVLRGEPPDPTAIPAGCRFHPRCPLRATLSEDAAQQCLAELPVLSASIGERQVACFHADVPLPEPDDARDPSEVRA